MIKKTVELSKVGQPSDLLGTEGGDHFEFDYEWPSETPLVCKDFSNTNVDLLFEKFGALSQNKNSIFSRICIGNSIISVEPYRGCPLNCSYCMANNDVRSLKTNPDNDLYNMIIRKPEKLFDTKLLVKGLIEHPAFIRNKTVIGFCTGSSEFFLPELRQNIWEGIQVLVENGLHNPIWIVVKSFLDKGNEDDWLKKFDYLHQNKIKVILSISDIGALKSIEPYQANRFADFAFLKNSNVYISHHMRPMIPNTENLEKLIYKLLENSASLVSSVCVGGLRIDPGMNIFWNNKDVEALSNDLPGNQVKHFDETIVDVTKATLNKLDCESVKMFTKTSQMLGHYINCGDFNLYLYRNELDGALLNIPIEVINSLESHKKACIEDIFKQIAGEIKLDNLKFKRIGTRIYVLPELKYQEHRALIHAIGHSKVLPC